MPAQWLPARFCLDAPISQGWNAIVLALRKQLNPGFPTAECGFQPHFEQVTVKVRFGQYPELANGLFLRTWHSGPHKGEPKIPKAVQTMIDRGLVEIRRNPMGWQAAFFTEAGLEALRQLLRDRRAMDPERFAHLRQELGL
jgi:hypothetical protein